MVPHHNEGAAEGAMNIQVSVVIGTPTGPASLRARFKLSPRRRSRTP